jgi:hypothetical protein
MSIQGCSDDEMIFYMFGSPESWIRAVAPFLFLFLDVVYLFIGGIGVNDFAVKD